MIQLPEDFAKDMRQRLGEEAYSQLAEALSQTPPVSIRLNPTKWLTDETAPVARLFDVQVPWTSQGYYLTERPAFTFDPLFHAGAYYVQEASSMFVEQAVRHSVTEPVVALDLCAAPGGKSTLLSSLLPEGSLLISNEPLRPRANILAENLIKWGNPAVVVTNNFPADFAPFPQLFDLILTDVPCSGEGMFRKDEQAITEWSRDNVQLCQARQRDILNEIWPSLKPGGYLVYSTCTFNVEEDEANIQWIANELGAEILPVPTEPEWGITDNVLPDTQFPVYRFIPGRTRGEGFFLALLRKNRLSDEENEEFALPKKKNKKKKETQRGKTVQAPIPAACRKWVNSDADFVYHWKEKELLLFPKQYDELYAPLHDNLNVLQAGITLGELKGKDLAPAHSLAMTSQLNLEAFPTVEVDFEQAVAFLRKEAISLPESTPRGYTLITYKQRVLGFVKNVGNRGNNLYPNEWRIRSGYVDDWVKE